MKTIPIWKRKKNNPQNTNPPSLIHMMDGVVEEGGLLLGPKGMEGISK